MKEFVQEIRSSIIRICNIRLSVAIHGQAILVQLILWANEPIQLTQRMTDISENYLNQKSLFWIFLEWSLLSIACTGKLGLLDGQVPKWSKYPKEKK